MSSFITPYESIREEIKKELEDESTFIEVFVKASLDTCKKRDVKGMYAKAEKGEIKNFTGVDDPFEDPKSPDLVLDTDKHSVSECVDKIMKTLTPILKK